MEKNEKDIRPEFQSQQPKWLKAVQNFYNKIVIGIYKVTAPKGQSLKIKAKDKIKEHLPSYPNDTIKPNFNESENVISQEVADLTIIVEVNRFDKFSTAHS